MGLKVALIDKSEIVHKMLSHCLYYYTIEVHRFDDFDSYLKSFHNEKPDLIFIDWEIKKGDQPIIYTAIDQFHAVPFVLLYRKTMEQDISAVSNQVPHKISKPINPKKVRDICVELIPELKNSALTSFLEFPKSAEEKNEESNKPSSIKSQPVKPIEKQEETKSFITNLINKTGLFKIPSPEEMESAEEQPETFKEASSSLESSEKSSIKASSNLVKQASSSLYSKNIKPTDTTSVTQNIISNKSPLEKNLDSSIAEKDKNPIKQVSSQKKTHIMNKPKNFNKENMQIDEDTQNSLAPMTIKNTPSGKTQSAQSHSLSKQDILQAFNKYKDSLEFQKLVEKNLTEYAQSAVSEILKPDSVKNGLKKPLEDFKQSAQFKQLVEKEISQYIQKQLPLVIKSIVEDQIKKIIGD
ncbi:MAG: hypothetical protein OXC37_03525 [Bdellovibrionaceae bacterium]|nr:hypothetical protein [Pseudobdellovibrionaceae bacterium]